MAWLTLNGRLDKYVIGMEIEHVSENGFNQVTFWTNEN